MTIDPHALAEDAIQPLRDHALLTKTDVRNCVINALAKLQAAHEAERNFEESAMAREERTAAVAEALERAACLQDAEADVAEASASLPISDGATQRRLKAVARDARNRAAAIRSLKPRSDMVCVPMEPTDVMREAALKAWDDRNYYAIRGYVNEDDAELCYKAMLAAAEGKSEKE